MPFSPSGVYTLPNGYAGVDGQPILTSQHNPPLEDIQAALSLTLLRDGRAPMVGNLNLNNFKINGLANGTATTDAVNLSQLNSYITATNTGGGIQLLLGNADLMIQFGSTIVGTNTAGQARVLFPIAFSSGTPFVIAMNGDSVASPSYIGCLPGTVDTTGFSFSTHNPALISGSFRANWVALGNKV
jgi:Coiled stalk of trimeric autotransporter adhesin